MENKCFVIKYPVSVDNADLPYLNSIQIDFTIPNGKIYTKVTQSGNVVYRGLNGLVVNNISNGEVEQANNSDVLVSGNGTLLILHAEHLTSIIPYNGTLGETVIVNVDKIFGYNSLEILDLYSSVCTLNLPTAESLMRLSKKKTIRSYNTIGILDTDYLNKFEVEGVSADILRFTGSIKGSKDLCNIFPNGGSLSLYGNSETFTWSGRSSKKRVVLKSIKLDNIDQYLIDTAVGTIVDDNAKTISLKGTRTTASDDAVASLKNEGYTIYLNGTADENKL